MRTATLQGCLSRRQMCRLSGVPRSSLGRRPRPESEWEAGARQAMREVALEFPAYGYRRVLAQMKRRSRRIGERRVRRWMREEGLSRPRKRAWKRTTDSNHAFAVYPNLAPTLTLSAPDQLWAAAITYVRLQARTFIFIAAVILDVFSRRIVAGGLGGGTARCAPSCHWRHWSRRLRQRRPAPVDVAASFRPRLAVRLEALRAAARWSRDRDFNEPQLFAAATVMTTLSPRPLASRRIKSEDWCTATNMKRSSRHRPTADISWSCVSTRISDLAPLTARVYTLTRRSRNHFSTRKRRRLRRDRSSPLLAPHGG